MADLSRSYEFDFSAPPSKVNRDLDAIMAKLRQVDQAVDKTTAKLKALGADAPGLKSMVLELGRLDTELKSKVGDAGRAEAALKRVGAGNSAVTTLTNRLKELEDELKRVSAEAGKASTATATVGSGPAAGGGVGGPPAAPAKGPGSTLMNVALAGHIAGMGARGARLVGGTFGEATKDHREFLGDAAKDSAKFRESLREYASLRKAPGPTDRIIREATRFASEAGVFPEEVVPFLNAYEGSAANGRDMGNIGGTVGRGGFTQEKQDALEATLKTRAAKFATRTGLDARTAGDLAGVVSTYKRIDSEADLAGQLGGLHYGLDKGRGEVSPLARSELAQAGSAIKSGRVSGLPELGAFIGQASIVSKSAGSAGTTYGQVSRLLNETGMGNAEQEAFVKESGMADAKGDLAKLKALRDHLAKVKPADANTYLESKGYGNSTDRRAVLGMVGNVDTLESWIGEANRVAANGRDVIDRDDANQRQMSSLNRKAEAAEFQSRMEVGMGAEKLRQGETFARARLADPNQPGGQRLKAGGLTVAQDAAYSAYKFGSDTGEEQRIRAEAVEGLIRGGEKVGVDVAKLRPGLLKNLGWNGQSPEKFASDYAAGAYYVEKAGGDPFGGGGGGDPAGNLRKAARLLDAAAEGMKNRDQGNRPPARPTLAPAPVGNGGAGVNPGRP